MALTCIVVDDAPYIVEQITEYINESEHLALMGAYTNPIAALEVISSTTNKIDILFTDLEMPGLSGL